MKKSIISYILVFALALMTFQPVLAVAAETEQDSIEIFVAPDGNDGNDGSMQHPLATMEGARKKVLEIKNTQNKKIIVNIRGGEYRVTSGVSFTESDSGTAEAPIVYRAYNGEKVTILGSVKLDPKDFSEVTNPDVLAKIPESAHGEVGELDLKKYGITSVEAYRTGMTYDSQFRDDARLYVNDDYQTLARYPNEGYKTIETVYARGNAGKNMEISYGDAPGERWTTATDAVVSGFFYYVFMYEKSGLISVDTKKGSLTTTPNGYGADKDRWWYIENLIEELDVPGEYFVDRSSMKLYYYPPYNLKDADIEIAILKNPFLDMTNASHITFDGITFKNCRHMGIQLMDCNNINIQNCEIANIGINGVYIKGGQDCTVYNCVVKYTGASGIDVFAGNYDTLERGGMKIIQNELYTNGTIARSYSPPIQLEGVENYAEYNTIHNCPYVAILHYGNDQMIRYNEIYNVMNHGSDGAAIYTGGRSAKRGSHVAYNYIHDVQSYFRMQSIGTKCLYIDDLQQGVFAHHNIGKNSGEALQIGGGQDNTVWNNLFIDLHHGLWMDDRGYTGGWQEGYAKPGGLTYEDYMQYGRNPIYLERYPGLADTMTPTFGTPKGNIVRDNLFVNMQEGDAYYTFESKFREFSTVENNFAVESLPFEDPDNHNYKIPEGSPVLDEYPWLKEVTGIMEEVGRPISSPATEDTIKLYYPRNGQTDVTNKDEFFTWDRIDGVDYYTIKIATDYKMQNVIFEKNTPENGVMINDLPTGNRILYWTVEGHMQGMHTQGTLAVKSKFPYVFRTAQYDTVSMKSFDQSLAEAKEMYNYVQSIEGPGSFDKEYAEKLGIVIKQAEGVAKANKKTQGTIDSLTTQLDELFADAKNHQDTESLWVRDMGDMVKFPALWVNQPPVEDGVITLGPKAAVIRTSFNMTNSSVLKTKMKYDAAGGWILVTLRQSNPAIYNDDYYGFVLKDDVIEFQRKSEKAEKTLFLDTIPNPLEPDKWYDMEFSVLDAEDGVHVKLVIDGEVLFEGTDTNMAEAVTGEGYFGINCESANSYISFKSAKDGVNTDE